MAIDATTALMRELDCGLVFTNLVETDQVYGHRKDVEGFHGALREIDAAAGVWLDLLRAATCSSSPQTTAATSPRPGPITRASTHRCSPPSRATSGRRHDGALADVGASCLRWLTGRDAPALPGQAFVMSVYLRRCPSFPRSRRSAGSWRRA